MCFDRADAVAMCDIVDDDDGGIERDELAGRGGGRRGRDGGGGRGREEGR